MPFARFLTEDIQSPWRIDCILLVLAFASAMVDTMTLPTIKVFVANNTGNLLLLGLGAAGLQKQYPELVFPDRAGCALAASWFGSYLTGQFINYFGKRRRFTIFTEFAFESLLIFISTILVYTKAVVLNTKTDFSIIFLLAWVFGSQGVITKTLGVPQIPAQVVTGAMADLWSDPKLLAPLRQNVPRNQRVAFIVVFFAGACVGGTVLLKVNAELVLLLTAILKLVVAGLFFLVPGVERPEKKFGDVEKGQVASVDKPPVVQQTA
ncbi:hypothetical protein T439DRAFT_380343 [Meredithblackwellia eburnea MCA 4105]